LHGHIKESIGLEILFAGSPNIMNSKFTHYRKITVLVVQYSIIVTSALQKIVLSDNAFQIKSFRCVAEMFNFMQLLKLKIKRLSYQMLLD
jgi:hypothetical protein